jgi:uncharacterized protein YcsI (UPF0317 family)
MEWVSFAIGCCVGFTAAIAYAGVTLWVETRWRR